MDTVSSILSGVTIVMAIAVFALSARVKSIRESQERRALTALRQRQVLLSKVEVELRKRAKTHRPVADLATPVLAEDSPPENQLSEQQIDAEQSAVGEMVIAPRIVNVSWGFSGVLAESQPSDGAIYHGKIPEWGLFPVGHPAERMNFGLRTAGYNSSLRKRETEWYGFGDPQLPRVGPRARTRYLKLQPMGAGMSALWTSPRLRRSRSHFGTDPRQWTTTITGPDGFRVTYVAGKITGTIVTTLDEVIVYEADLDEAGLPDRLIATSRRPQN